MIMSPDVGLFASPAKGGSSMTLWDAATGEQREEPVNVQRVAFSSDGKTVATGSSGPDIRIWDIETMSQKGNTLKVDSPVEWLAFSPNGQTLVAESKTGSVCLWDLKDLAGIMCTPWVRLEDRTEHDDDDKADKVNVNEKEDKDDDNEDDEDEGDEGDKDDKSYTVNVNERGDKEDQNEVDEEVDDDDDDDAYYYELKMRQNFRYLIWSSDGRKLRHFSSHESQLSDVGQQEQIGEVWDVDTSETMPIFAFSSDGRILAMGDDYDGSIKLLDAETRTQTGVLSRTITTIVTHLLFSADDKMLASCNGGDGIVIWELEGEDGWRVTRLLEGYSDRLCDIAFSYGTEMFASSAERTWDLETEVQTEELALTGHTSLVVCLAFSPDGRTLASGSIEGSICLWDAELGIQTGHITSDHSGLPMSLHYAEDGRKLVASHGMRVTSGIVAGPLPTSDTLSAENSNVRECGEIDEDGWVMYGSERWFWLPISGGGWLMHGTCLAVRTGFCIFIFDVSGVMDMIPKDQTR